MLFSGEIYTVGKYFTLPPAVTVVRNLTSAPGLYFSMFVITGFNQIFNKVCGKGKNHLDTSGGDGNSHLGKMCNQAISTVSSGLLCILCRS